MRSGSEFRRRLRWRRPWRMALTLALACAAGDALAQRRGGEPRLADSIEVVVLPHQILALGAGNGSVSESLELTERVRWSDSHGDLAIAVTDRRILTVSVDSGSWRTTQIRLGEKPDVEALLGQRISLFATSQRVLGFGTPANQIVQRDIGPNETVTERRVGDAVALVVTDRQALGLSAQGGGFIPVDLRIHEKIQSVSARARSASVHTSQRVLTFDGRTLSWSETDIPLY